MAKEMIYTLYSFKGGVGRSMARPISRNAFSKGPSSDHDPIWDLEAPGLENYFYSPAPTPGSTEDDLTKASGRPGLIDMLMKYKEKFPEIARRRESITTGGTNAPLMQATDDSGDREQRARDLQTVEEITKQFLASVADVPMS